MDVFCECYQCRINGIGKIHPVTFAKIPGSLINRRAYQRHQKEEATRVDREELLTQNEIEKSVLEATWKESRRGPSLGVQLRDLNEHPSNRSLSTPPDTENIQRSYSPMPVSSP
jgi:hypothetical protein